MFTISGFLWMQNVLSLTSSKFPQNPQIGLNYLLSDRFLLQNIQGNEKLCKFDLCNKQQITKAGRVSFAFLDIAQPAMCLLCMQVLQS